MHTNSNPTRTLAHAVESGAALATSLRAQGMAPDKIAEHVEKLMLRVGPPGLALNTAALNCRRATTAALTGKRDFAIGDVELETAILTAGKGK